MSNDAIQNNTTGRTNPKDLIDDTYSIISNGIEFEANSSYNVTIISNGTCYYSSTTNMIILIDAKIRVGSCKYIDLTGSYSDPGMSRVAYWVNNTGISIYNESSMSKNSTLMIGDYYGNFLLTIYYVDSKSKYYFIELLNNRMICNTTYLLSTIIRTQ